MNISLQQYNAVVSGLRTQLELHRTQFREQSNMVSALINEVNELRRDREMSTKVIELISGERDDLTKQLVCCGQIAEGNFSGQEVDSEACQKVAKLRLDFEAKAARKRKK